MEKEELKDYFNRYPQSDEVFENGGILFHQHGPADSFTKGDTTRYTRSKVMAEETETKIEDGGDNGEVDETKTKVEESNDNTEGSKKPEEKTENKTTLKAE